MIDFIRQLFRSETDERRPSIPEGQRVYAIGDIHGRLDLFAAIAQAIEQDDEARGPAETTVILLGDLVDRGPESAAVVEGARTWTNHRRVRLIGGNHEEMFLTSFHDEDALRNFLKIGGRETILSYPIERDVFQSADLSELQRLMRERIPQADLDYLANSENSILIGDYLFVHAGIRPDQPIGEQHGRDLRWIREPFLSYPGNFGCIVVHGHSIEDEVQIRPNRIGIDTGAFVSGRLTALGLEGAQRWLIETAVDEDVITSSRAI